jgi:hypothetical protein
MEYPLTREVVEQGRPVARGQVLLGPADPRPARVGPGVRLQGDGRMVADVSGLAMITPEEAWVVPAEVYPGDMARIWEGDSHLVVLGGLMYGAQVRTTGCVAVRGSALGARAEAGGEILVLGGVSQSILTAGAGWEAYELAADRLEALDASFADLQSVIRQLEANPAFKMLDLQTNLRPLMEIVVEHSFAALPLQVSEAIRRLESILHLGERIRPLYTRLSWRFAGMQLLTITQADLAEVRLLLGDVLGLLERIRSHPPALRVTGAVEHSTLRSSGAVTIAGGCRSARVDAGRWAQVDGQITNAYVTARERIGVDQVSQETTLEVREDGTISARSVAAGTLVRVGSSSVRLRSSVGPCLISRQGSQVAIQPREEVRAGV